MVNQVAIRLGTSGKGEVKSDFAEVKAAGTDALKAVADGARLAGDAGEQQARRLSTAFDRATADLEAAEQRRRSAAARLSAVSSQTPVQAQIGAAVSSGYGDYAGSAKESAIAIAGLVAEQERLEKRVHLFKAAMDPAYAAQARFNQEMSEARGLISQGAISLDEYSAKLQQERVLLMQSTAANDRHTVSEGQKRHAMQQMSFQLNDMATMYAMGASAQQIFVSQAGQVIQATQMMSGGTNKLAAFLGGPWGMAITTATVVMVPFIAKLWETEGAANRAEAAVKSLAQARAQAAADYLKITDAERELNKLVEERAMLQNQRDRAGRNQFRYGSEFRRISELDQEILTLRADIDLATKGERDKEIRGTQELINARAKLAGATTALDRAQAQYTLTTREADAEFEKSGKSAADQARLQERRTAAERALNLAQDANSKSNAGRTASIARQSAAMEVSASAALEVARAYLNSAEAGELAEARRKALTEATRKGISVEQQAARQIAIANAERIVEAAKSASALNQESDARAAVRQQLLEGKIAANDMDEALRNELALRPLATLQARLQGAELNTLTSTIDALTAAQKRNREEADMGRALAGMKTAQDEFADIKKAAQYLGLSENERAMGHFLVTEFGAPFSVAGFGNKMREWCDQAGLPHCSAHGLRKAMSRRLAESGASDSQGRSVTGHKKDQTFRYYAAEANWKSLADDAMANLEDRRLANLSKSGEKPIC